MLERRAVSYLEAWSRSSCRKPLVLRGARQVGKSTLVRILANKTHMDLVTINFEKKPEWATVFASHDPVEIKNIIELRLNLSIIPQKTLLFLDEVQKTPEVLLSLRYFYEDMPQLHVIAAGSLLDFELKNPKFSIPVGRIEYMYINPLTFEEFLLALGEKKLVDFLMCYEIDGTYSELIHQKLISYLKKYWLIGGMPEAVSGFLKEDSYQYVDKVRETIIETYQDDFAKYAGNKKEEKIRMVYRQLPRFVGKKIKYSNIDPDSKSTLIAESIEKLKLAKVIHLIYHSHCNGMPLSAERNEKIFKPIFLDIGLLCSHLQLSVHDLIEEKELLLVNQGVMAEQFIGQQLISLWPYFQNPQLHYWVRQERSSNAEIDYVINKGSKIIPIEVKSGKTGSLKSLHYFLKEKKLSFGVRFNSDHPSIFHDSMKLPNFPKTRYTLLSLPLYFSEQLYRFL